MNTSLKDDIKEVLGVFGGVLVFLIILGAFGWMIYVHELASYPSREDPDCEHTPGCHWVLLASTTKFRTDDIRLKLWKGGSLSVYVDRHKFEAIPFPDRDGVLQPMVKGWCEYHSGPLIPSVWFTDIRTGSSLISYGCFSIAMSRLWEEVSQSTNKPKDMPSPGKR